MRVLAQESSRLRGGLLTWTAARPAQKRRVLAKASAHMGQVKPLARFSIICVAWQAAGG